MSTDRTISEFVVPGGTHVIKIVLKRDYVVIQATSPFPDCDDWSRQFTYPEFSGILWNGYGQGAEWLVTDEEREMF